MSWMLVLAAAQPLAAEAAAPARGVIAYPPTFFAEAQPTNAFDMVGRLPGFTFDKGATVRGLSGSGGNVLIDGQAAVAKNDTLEEILKRIPARSVERVELIRGGAPGIDMEGRTVVANVVRKSVAGLRGAVMPGVYFLYDGRVLTGIRVEGQYRFADGRLAEFGQVHGKGPDDSLGDGRRVRINADGTTRLRSRVDADAGGSRIFTTGAYETPLAGGRARINGAYMLNPASVEIYDRIEGGGLEYEYDKIKRLQAELGGRFSRPLTPQLSMEAVAFQQWNNNKTTVHFEAPGLARDFLLDRKTTESVGRLNLRRRQSATVSLEAGVEAALNRLSSETALTVNSRAVLVPAANVEVEERRGEVFARGTWRVRPNLTLEAGVRQEFSRVTSEGDVTLAKSLAYTKPRVALTFAPDPASQVRLRLEREVGQLNFEDFVASSQVASTGVLVAGNPNLAPQQAWVAEAAYERRFWGAGAAVLTARHYEINDVIDRGPVRDAAGVPFADRPDNVGKGTRDEVAGSLTLPLERLRVPAAQLRGQVTWRRTRATDQLTGQRREISGQRPIDWEVHFTQDLPSLRTTWGVDVMGAYRERFYRLNEVETRKQSTWVVVFAEHKPRPDLILRLEAQGATQRNVKRIREVYRGPRHAAPLDFIDIRDLEWGGSLYLRVRKTFG